MFIETSYPRLRGDRARLESSIFQRTTGQGSCMNFFYHMSGSGIGTLNVYMRVMGRSMSKLWTQSGDKGKTWLEGQIPILSAGNSYQVKCVLNLFKRKCTKSRKRSCTYI
jgi:hypothetical protein